ncbi:metallophosphoesterase, DNA ligase-associated [Anaerohalosphaera lusitana]|uniref:Metallophosphoesterase, DNA ligase-associated n=1 Tax=Anaerohalosphaera lusitana TaxID=1936003 RepID=A0A1U9NHN6_9BACT|nr:UDP-2,3-diacylglucosamine diphosphatase [Anaerohalosphaera lusitana]AQT67287.1 metallophosphoesterase, DNA ligase-associated [Anaerohalosphaera lusitana]
MITQKQIKQNGPLFIISDLHLGSGGARDEFASSNKRKLLAEFLDMVESEAGQVVILGDLVDLWRFNLRSVVRTHRELFDRLYEMNAIYVVGNHDRGLRSLKAQTVHPLLGNVTGPVKIIHGKRDLVLMHGHEVDAMNKFIRPGFGKMLGISAYPIERWTGGQVFTSEVIADKILELQSWFLTAILNMGRQMNSFINPHDSLKHLSRDEVFASLRKRRDHKFVRMHEHRKADQEDTMLVSAHTHRAGRFSDWYFNSGSWTGIKQNFLRILPDGLVDIADWTTSGIRPLENQFLSCA